LTSSLRDDLAQSLHRYGLLHYPSNRLAAFIASGEMAVACFLTSFSGKTLNHTPSVLERLLPILNKGELPVLFCFMCFANNVLRPGSFEY